MTAARRELVTDRRDRPARVFAQRRTDAPAPYADNGQKSTDGVCNGKMGGDGCAASLLTGASTATAQETQPMIIRRTARGYPQGALAQAERDPHSSRDPFKCIPSPDWPLGHEFNATVPITKNTSAVPAINLPDTPGVKRHVRRRTGEGPSMLHTPPAFAGRDRFLRQPLPRT